MKDIKKDFAARLTRLRNNAEKDAFWRGYDLNPAKMGRYENRKEAPSLEKIIDICEKLDVSPTWLLLGKGRQKLSEITEPDAPTVLEIKVETVAGLVRLLNAEKPRPKQEIFDVLGRYIEDERGRGKVSVIRQRSDKPVKPDTAIKAHGSQK